MVTLTPKVTTASCMKEFRPTACFSLLYKIISRIITDRLQLVLPDIINENQTAFIKGRVIFYNKILSDELIKGHSRKNIKSPRCMVKIGLQKAYGCVEWPFIKHPMIFLGFPVWYIGWVLKCLSTVLYSFNVNGETIVPFKAKKGLRQGHPISPYLFVICLEYLK